MGEVYHARDNKLQREVALKLLPEHFARDPERIMRLRREAQMLAQLNHPNIAILYNFEETASARFLVSETAPPTYKSQLTGFLTESPNKKSWKKGGFSHSG